MHKIKEKVAMLWTRPIRDSDAAELYKRIEASRPDLSNLVWAADATLRSTQKFIEQKNDGPDEVNVIISDGAIIGCIELRLMDGFRQLGYWLGTTYRGKGYMTQAVKQFMLFERRETRVMIHPQNAKSLAIVRAAGFIETHEDADWKYLTRKG
jgi:RimJ/RimL family protein N-acetyltransferase